MTLRLPSLTVIGVVDAGVPEAAALDAAAGAALSAAVDVEIVLVVNPSGVGAEGRVLALKALTQTVPDLTIVVLSDRVHDDVARLVGIEHAVGDAILFCTIGQDDPAGFADVLAPLQAGYDVVIADVDAAPRSPAQRWLVRFYCAAYRAMTGMAIDLRPTGLRAMSRAAALYVAGCGDAALRLRMRSLGPSFPATVVRVRGVAVPRTGGHGWAEGLGLLLSASSLPLRGASYAALAAGALSGLYSLYVFAVFLLKPDVASGWTTLSLQLSGMMFVFSIVLLFMAEYVIQIHAGSPPRSRRFLVVRELRSTLSRRARLLNVVDGEGVFQLGKPDWAGS